MADLNPLSDEFRNNREAVFTQLRDNAPVLMTDQGVALISRYADVRAAALDAETFSSGGPWDNPARPVMNTMDPPEHGLFVAMTKSAFDERYQAGLEDSFRAIARALVTDAGARSECDLIHDVVAPYMFSATGLLLDLTADQVDELREVDRRIQRFGNGEPQEGPSAMERSDTLFSAVIEERRANPGTDHVSALLAVGSDGGRALTEIELLEYLFRFTNGNGITACAAIGNGVELLARHPEQRADLVADPSLIPQAFEEMQRREGPTHDSTRVTTREVTVAGVTLPTNTPLRLLWGAANLDERQFSDPEQFDIHRDSSSQLALSIGEHFCYGAYLARLEARVLFEELLRGLPDFTPTGPPVRVKSVWSWGFESIPVSIP
ncbi:MAG: cytochrome P450 [Actinobacteria bacterium]|nr:cytochrome P450 [Actinomycetota bacterium]